MSDVPDAPTPETVPQRVIYKTTGLFGGMTLTPDGSAVSSKRIMAIILILTGIVCGIIKPADYFSFSSLCIGSGCGLLGLGALTKS
jgi:hypothetical protein